MQIEDLVKRLYDMMLIYGDRMILTITDGESEYYIKDITGKQCAEYFEPEDNVAETIINISKRK